MKGDRPERLAVWTLRALAVAFAAVGILFLAAPDGTLGALDDLGEWLPLGEFEPAPESAERLWLALGFAYMTVIAGICLLAQSDLARYRPLLLVLAAGKAASSIAALGFFLFDADVFAYLLNFVVDGLLVGVALWIFSLAGRAGPAPAPG